MTENDFYRIKSIFDRHIEETNELKERIHNLEKQTRELDEEADYYVDELNEYETTIRNIENYINNKLELNYMGGHFDYELDNVLNHILDMIKELY